MSCRCGSKPYLNSIKMIKSLPPYRNFLCRITPVAFISNDKVKSMNGNIKLFCILIHRFVTARKYGCFSEQVNGHPLNCGHIHKTMLWLRISEVRFRYQSGIKRFILIQITPLKTLAINLICFIKFQLLLCFKRGKRPDHLCSKCSSVNKKQDSFCNTCFHQPVDKINSHECLSCSRSHCNQHCPFPINDSIPYGITTFTLIVSHHCIIWHIKKSVIQLFKIII